MHIKKKTLRVVRNLLYRFFNEAEHRYRQANRVLLRHVSDGPDPVATATSITDRFSSDEWQQLQPVWVLSTGRTGTNTMTELFRLSPKVDAYHEPSPELFQFSYDYHMNRIERSEALRALMYLRDEIVFRSFRDGLVYVETNNRVTYIADLLLELYPKSRFVHVFRHPYDFIRSGMRRTYYNGHMRDSARIIPAPENPYRSQWAALSAMEKVAWYWATVNSECIRFLEHLPPHQKMSFSSERFFEAPPVLISHLFDFIGSADYHPPRSDVERVMNTKYNAQREGSFSRPKEWTDKQISSIDDIVGSVAAQLSYELLTNQNTKHSMHIESADS